MTHEAQFPNGILEYIVHVVQSKFTVQSNFKITHACILFVSDTMERMDLTKLYIGSLFILSPNSPPLYFEADLLKDSALKYSSRPSPRQLSSLPWTKKTKNVSSLRAED